MDLAERLQLYPVLRTTVMLVLGIVVGKSLYPVVSPALLILIVATSLVATLLMRKHALAQSIGILLTFFFIGAYVMNRSLHRLNVALPDGYVDYQAVVMTEPAVHGKVVQTDLLIVGSNPMKVRASILRDTVDNRWQRIHVGDGICATSRLEQPRNFHNATFDYAAWLKEHGFVATTFIYYSDWQKAKVGLTSLPRVDRLVLMARKFRQRLLSQYRGYGADGQAYAVLAAMTLGDKSALSKELKDDYSIAGASHVLALSGLHLGIIYAVLSMLTFRFRRKWFSQLMIMLAIWAYAVVVGLMPSVVRAAVMLSIVAMMTIINRQRLTVNSLAVAAMIMLLCNPLNLYDIGFEMSFMAVLGIAICSPLYGIVPFYGFWGRMLSRLWSVVAVSIAAQLGTAPLVAYYFGRFSTYFILTNLIVIPCATILLYGAVTVAAFSWSAAIASWLTGKILIVIQVLNAALHWIASLPGACIDGLMPSKWQVVGIYALLLSAYIMGLFLQDLFSFDHALRHRVPLELLFSNPKEDHTEQDQGEIDNL